MEEARSGCCGGKKRSWHDQETVRQLVVRLNRIEGQVRGIRRMIEEDVYCDDVLNQTSSVRSAKRRGPAAAGEAHEALPQGAAFRRRR